MTIEANSIYLLKNLYTEKFVLFWFFEEATGNKIMPLLIGHLSFPVL